MTTENTVLVTEVGGVYAACPWIAPQLGSSMSTFHMTQNCVESEGVHEEVVGHWEQGPYPSDKLHLMLPSSLWNTGDSQEWGYKSILPPRIPPYQLKNMA